MKKLLTLKVSDVTPYINWIYFFHAWGFEPRFTRISQIHGCDACKALWVANFPEKERIKAIAAMQLYKEAQRMLLSLENDIEILVIYKLCKANSIGNNILLDNTLLPLLRQQAIHAEGMPNLCLSDYVRPLSSGIPDTVGVFAASVPPQIEEKTQDDSYKHLLIQTLSDRLVEAAIEKTHKQIRQIEWGYAPDEQLSISELLEGKFQGIRPAVGYPSLPDQSINFILDKILDYKSIGISLTENGAMYPHASISGLMISHPAAKYFSVGEIGKDQLEDYSRRRGMSIEQMKKFLIANCDY